jgi:hypothetical protein
MLVAQFVILNFVDDSHGHVFIVNSIVDSRFRRPGSVIHKEFILTGPDAFMLSVEGLAILLLRCCCRLTFMTQLPGGRQKAPLWLFYSFPHRQGCSGAEDETKGIRTCERGFCCSRRYHAKGLVIQESPAITTLSASLISKLPVTRSLTAGALIIASSPFEPANEHAKSTLAMVEHACGHVIQVNTRPLIPTNALVILNFLESK